MCEVLRRRGLCNFRDLFMTDEWSFLQIVRHAPKTPKKGGWGKAQDIVLIRIISAQYLCILLFKKSVNITQLETFGSVKEFNYQAKSKDIDQLYMLSLDEAALEVELRCCCFTSYQHIRAYPDGYRLVTVRTHGDLIVLLTGKPGCRHHDSWIVTLASVVGDVLVSGGCK